MPNLTFRFIVALGTVLLLSSGGASAQESAADLTTEEHLFNSSRQPAAAERSVGWQLPQLGSGWERGAGWSSSTGFAPPVTSIQKERMRRSLRFILEPDAAGLRRYIVGSELHASQQAAGSCAKCLTHAVKRSPARRFHAVQLSLSGPQLRRGNQERRLTSLSGGRILLGELSTAEGGGKWERRLAIAQGSYYLATGLWPIFDMGSFEKVTGPKTDDWLVKTVGAMIAVVGGTLLVSGLREGPSTELKMLGAGSAAALAVVDVTYVAKGRISRIYLLDAAAELALVTGWGLTLIK